MSLFNLILKAIILVLDLRDTYDALDAVKLDEIGRHERQVLVRNAEDGTKQVTTRKRVGTSKRKAAVKSALTTVLVWNLFHKVEPLCDRTIAWFVPFYDSFKTLFLIWMLFTRSYGASILVYRFLAPIIRPYEPIIDGIFELVLSLFAWIATLLAPITDHGAVFVQRLKLFLGQTHQPQEMYAVSNNRHKAPQRKTSTASIGEQGKKKPPPPSSPPASIKASPSSATSALAENGMRPQSRAAVAKARQPPTKKASQSNLAATRRVLQELPVPRHAFDPIVPQASTSAPFTASKGQALPSSPTGSSDRTTSVKTEPSEPIVMPPIAPLGPPPTPPTGLHNYAFIPGMTPQRSGPASLASPTPRFPGGFSFSFAAASQAAASNGAHPSLVQARVPATAQMAPLSVSSSQTTAPTPISRSSLLGLPNGATNSVATHESVASANDDRVVPPPVEVAGVRKVSSSRSLKSKADAAATDTTNKTSALSNGKKRPKPDEDSEGHGDKAGKSVSSSSSPRKRAKGAAGKVKASNAATGSATAKARVRTKPALVTGSTTVTGSNGDLRKKAAGGTTTRIAHKPTASTSTATNAAQTGAGSTLVEEEPTASKTSTSEKKKKHSSSRLGAVSAKTTTQRTAAKKTTGPTNSRSQSLEASEASEPAQRLTRSRTRQNLVD